MKLFLDNKPLFILEIANNHVGKIEKGIEIIDKFSKLFANYPHFRFAFKLQYRDLNTFIHPDFVSGKEKMVRRFLDNALSLEEFKILRDKIRDAGVLGICTPFDEASVENIEAHEYDVLKIGSCSFNDWPLLEAVAKTRKDLPIILSTGGASAGDIENVVSFFKHRERKIALMHCVAEYPTSPESANLQQILFLKKFGVPVGFSTHEAPYDHKNLPIAIGMGAMIFERHITDGYLNGYSSTVEDIKEWLEVANDTGIRHGGTGRVTRNNPSEKEIQSLSALRRGAFAKRDISANEKISIDDVFFAIPSKSNFPRQITANDMSKYSEFMTSRDIKKNEPITEVIYFDKSEFIKTAMSKARAILIESGLKLPSCVDAQISHHYTDLNRFWANGAVILNLINKEYCKKLIIMLPGQAHPFHCHKVKSETFNLLWGDLRLHYKEPNGPGKENNTKIFMKVGDIIDVNAGMSHSFSSENGAVIEEISTTHYADDSYYEDDEITQNKERKTITTILRGWVNE